jgi:hypothetical protein
MSNQMILEFAHRRIQELHEELRDMENIIEAFTSYDDEMGGKWNVCNEYT